MRQVIFRVKGCSSTFQVFADGPTTRDAELVKIADVVKDALKNDKTYVLPIGFTLHIVRE